MNNLQQEFEALIQKQQELRKQFQDSAQKIFMGVTKEFFDKNPGITAFSWNQYAPYFNDGEECVFSVNTPTFTNVPLDELDQINQWGEYEGDSEGVWTACSIKWVLDSTSEYYQPARDLINSGPAIDSASCEFMSDIIQSGEMEDVMRAMFGDSVSVVATRDGFKVNTDFDHD